MSTANSCGDVRMVSYPICTAPGQASARQVTSTKRTFFCHKSFDTCLGEACPGQFVSMCNVPTSSGRLPCKSRSDLFLILYGPIIALTAFVLLPAK